MTMLLALLGGSFVALANGNVGLGSRLTTAAGSFGFVATIFVRDLLASTSR